MDVKERNNNNNDNDNLVNKIEIDGKDLSNNGTSNSMNLENRNGTKILNEEESVPIVKAYETKFNVDLNNNAAVIAVINASHNVTMDDGLNVGKHYRDLVVDWAAITLDDFGNKARQPFELLDEIPRIFELRSVLNSNQLPDQQTTILATSLNTTDVIQKARELWNHGTLTTRVYLRSKVNGHEITSPNTYDSGALKIYNLDDTPITFSSEIHGAEARLRSMIDIFIAFDGKLYTFPSKLIAHRITDCGVMSNLSSMPLHENMYPHFYYSIFSFRDQWFVNELERLYENAPIVVGDGDPVSISGMKVYAFLDTITDQFAAELARINYNKLRTNQCTIDKLQARYEANSFEDTSINLLMSPHIELMAKYQPSETEANAFMYYLLVSKTEKTKISQRLQVMLENLKLFNTLEISDTIGWSNLPIISNGDNTRENIKVALMNAANTTFEQFLIFETFSNFFTFDFKVVNDMSVTTAMFNLLSIIVMAKTFPNLFQKSIGSLGYIAMLCFRNIFPQEMIWFQKTYGSVVSINGVRNAQSFGLMTDDNLLSGQIYSIFSDFSSRQIRENAFLRLISDFKKLCTPNRHQYFLKRKQLAGYPYINSSYTTTLSWPDLSTNLSESSRLTDWANDLSSVASFGKEMVGIKFGKGENNTPTVTPKNFMLRFLDSMSVNFTTTASLYQHSAARVQKMLKESFAYVFDEFDDNALHPFQYPRPLVMTTLGTQRPLYIQSIHVSDLSLHTAMRFALTTQGLSDRNIAVSTDKPTPIAQPILKTGYIEGHLLDRMYLESVSSSRNLNLALYITRMIREEGTPSPFSEFASAFSNYLKVTNWIPLSKEIFKMFGMDWESYFTSGTAGFDTRDMSKTLYRMGRDFEPDYAGVNNDELLGKDFSDISTSDKDMFNVISKLFFKVNNTTYASAIIPKSKGFYLGRFYVDDMMVGTPYGNWTPVAKGKWEIVTVQVSGHVGLKYVLKIKTLMGEKEYTLPHIKENIQYILHADWTSDIDPSFRHVLAQAIYEGKIAVKFNMQEVAAESIIDVADKLLDVSENLDVKTIESILKKPSGDVLQWDFRSTAYATNFSTNFHVVSSYVQWVTPLQNLNSSLFAAALTPGVKSQKCMLPLPEMLEYGKTNRIQQNQLSNGTLKIDSGVVNWNNRYPVINKKLFQVDVDIRYTPRSDVFMGQRS